MSKKERSTSRELSEISKALEIAEEKRFAAGLTLLQKKELEQASIVLRDRERELILLIGQDIAESIKGSGAQLEILAKNIRARTKKMSKTTQSIKNVKQAILLVSRLAT